MGIEYREYMSNGPTYRGSGVQGWSAVKTLIVLNVIIFVLQVMFPQLLETFFALDTKAVLYGQIWRLTTYDFLHDATSDLPFHLLFNMLLLWVAGGRVEAALGKKEFLAFYLLAGIFSGIVFMLWGIFTNTAGVAIGASGAAISVMILYAMYWPTTRWYIWGILPIPVGILALLAAASDIFPMIHQLTGRGPGSNIAHAAHLGGMIFGVLYARNRWEILSWFHSRRRSGIKNPFKKRPNLKVLNPTADDDYEEADNTIPPAVEARLDRLLEKILEQGESSLTDEERQFLSDVSRRYKNRRH